MYENRISTLIPSEWQTGSLLYPDGVTRYLYLSKLEWDYVNNPLNCMAVKAALELAIIQTDTFPHERGREAGIAKATRDMLNLYRISRNNKKLEIANDL